MTVSPAGKFDKRITIQAQTLAANDHGEMVQTWGLLHTVWASITTLAGDELTIARQVAAKATHQIRIRYFASLTVKHRIKFGTRIFDINAINNIEEKNAELILICSESV